MAKPPAWIKITNQRIEDGAWHVEIGVNTIHPGFAVFLWREIGDYYSWWIRVWAMIQIYFMGVARAVRDWLARPWSW